jgi:ribosomal protein L11 methyltransferase
MKTPTDPCWVVDVTIAGRVALHPGEALSRDDFLLLVWELLDGTGLCGVHEGSLDADEAFAAGITSSACVLDAAAGDPDRDWVAARDTITAAFWFGDESGARAAAALLAPLDGCDVGAIRCEQTHDWEAEFRASHGPIDVPGFGRILPPWEAAAHASSADAQTTLVIDPGTGFGTGLHPTTQLCLAALAGGTPRDRSAWGSVLDFGAGSGILGIAAALRGARGVEAVESDSRVHEAIGHNAALNAVAGRVRVSATLAELSANPLHDLILANIVAPVLGAHADELCRRLAPGGRIVLCGLLSADVPDIAAVYRRLLATEPIATELEGWHCLEFRTG